MKVVQVGAVFKLGLQVGVVNLVYSSWRVQVGVPVGVVNSWFPSFDGGSIPSTSKVNPLGEVEL
jgi:hypothetical protein